MRVLFVVHVQGYSSVGRTLVSKTKCRGFESFCPCFIIRMQMIIHLHPLSILHKNNSFPSVILNNIAIV